MEIHLDKRAVRQIRLSAQEAIEEDDTESLREDILEAFTEDQVEEIERRLDNGDFFEFLTDVIDEWSGDDVDELLELLETQLGEVGIDLKTEISGLTCANMGAACGNRTHDLRITRVFPCAPRGFKSRSSFMSAGCCWRRSLVVDGSSGTSRGHVPVRRRPRRCLTRDDEVSGITNGRESASASCGCTCVIQEP